MIKDYEVTVSFAGLTGTENTYSVGAKSREEAEEIAIDLASDDLTVDSIEYDEDSSSYEVEVGFCGFIGGSETYQVYAEYEDAAEEEALDQAKSALTVQEVICNESAKDDIVKVAVMDILNGKPVYETLKMTQEEFFKGRTLGKFLQSKNNFYDELIIFNKNGEELTHWDGPDDPKYSAQVLSVKPFDNTSAEVIIDYDKSK